MLRSRYRYVLRPVLHLPAVLYSILLAAVLGAALWGLQGTVLAVSGWLAGSSRRTPRPARSFSVAAAQCGRGVRPSGWE